MIPVTRFDPFCLTFICLIVSNSSFLFDLKKLSLFNLLLFLRYYLVLIYSCVSLSFVLFLFLKYFLFYFYFFREIYHLTSKFLFSHICFECFESCVKMSKGNPIKNGVREPRRESSHVCTVPCNLNISLEWPRPSP